jgi:nitroreductase
MTDLDHDDLFAPNVIADQYGYFGPLGTDAFKPYLETAPYLIAVFAERYGLERDGARHAHDYVIESVGIATGFLLAALHHAGLATLTHTPNPLGFLHQILERSSNERAVMMVVAGYPASGVLCYRP